MGKLEVLQCKKRSSTTIPDFPFVPQILENTKQGTSSEQSQEITWSGDCSAVCLQPGSIPEACVHQCIGNAYNNTGSFSGKWWNFSQLDAFKC